MSISQMLLPEFEHEMTTTRRLLEFAAVSVWCRRFAVTFGAAALGPVR